MDGSQLDIPIEATAPPAIERYLRIDAGLTARKLNRGAFGTYPHRDTRFVREVSELLNNADSALVTDSLLVPRETIFDSIANAISLLPYQVVFCSRCTDVSMISKKEIIFRQEKRRRQIGIFVDPPSELQFTTLWMRTDLCIDVYQFSYEDALAVLALRLPKMMNL
jgi:hypothetical protein